ncbi:het domain-containing protein [Seiridium cupressi]
MRLIDTHTHLLLEPWKAAGKEYAILSHTWGAEEVIFQEWEQLFPSGAIKGQCPHVRYTGINNKAGYHKVMQACEQAKRDGIRWLWCDTMCINKESSAELSEAINSMFQWYSNATVCYSYLTDVVFHDQASYLDVFPSPSNTQGWFLHAIHQKQDQIVQEVKSRFMGSRWWTRGWTLQELLAPENVVFFSRDWRLLGRKADLASWITASTNIHREALEDKSSIRKFSIAQRMSWMANRQTTVIEDMAYCLLGIFNINMPMLYGQGPNAFQKLQEEIINTSDDQSILAWSPSTPYSSGWTGALARSPTDFHTCGSIICDEGLSSFPYAQTNLGLRLKGPLISSTNKDVFFLGLNCCLELRGNTRSTHVSADNRYVCRRFQVWIILRKTGEAKYKRGHTPKSILHFQECYPMMNSLKVNEIFVGVPASRQNPRYDHGEPKPAHSVTHSGITVTVSFGNMGNLSRAFLEVRNPCEFSIHTWSIRGPLRLSHQVISCGEFSVILSVSWDLKELPRQKMYTILRNPSRTLLAELAEKLTQTCTISSAPSDEASILMAHRYIKGSYQVKLATSDDEDCPQVFTEDETLLDSHGRAEVVVDIIFKKKQSTPGWNQ